MGRRLRLICGPAAVLVLTFLGRTAAAQEYRPGDEVVVIAEGNLTVQNGAVDEVWPGLVLKVTAVNGKWLWVSNGKPGWLDRQNVIPLDRAAVDRLTAMLRAHPNDPDLYASRANVWRSLGEIDIAIGDLNEAIRLDPSWGGNYSERGLAWDDKGEYDKAIADYNEALRLDPKDSVVYSNRGIAWYEKGEYDKAIADYDEALRLDPKDSLAYGNRGNAWEAKGEYDKAIADENEALRLDSKDALAYRNRGLAWHDKGEYDKAIADYDEALRVDPKYGLAYGNRGNAWHAKGEYDKAMADDNEALRLDSKNAFAYRNRGNEWWAKGEHDKALADYDEALRLDPKDGFTHLSRSMAHMLLRRPEAVGGFQAVLDVEGWKGTDSPYAVILGTLAARQAKDEAASQRFLTGSAGQLHEKWPYPVVRFLRGEIDEPALLELAIDDNKRTEAHCYLGLDGALAGRTAEALAHFTWVKEHGTKHYIEYTIALAELRRLEGAAGE